MFPIEDLLWTLFCTKKIRKTVVTPHNKVSYFMVTLVFVGGHAKSKLAENMENMLDSMSELEIHGHLWYFIQNSAFLMEEKMVFILNNFSPL